VEGKQNGQSPESHQQSRGISNPVEIISRLERSFSIALIFQGLQGTQKLRLLRAPWWREPPIKKGCVVAKLGVRPRQAFSIHHTYEEVQVDASFRQL
jgi:hypothetical protein